MAYYEISCPGTAYINSRVQVSAKTDDSSVEKAVFTWQGAIQHIEESWDPSKWGSFSSSTYATTKGRVDVEVAFYDASGQKKESKHCYFYVQ